MSIKTTPNDVITMLEDNVAMCVRIFRQYELMHLNKTPPDKFKAERNAEYAMQCEKSLDLLEEYRKENV